MIKDIQKKLKLHFNYHKDGYFITTGKARGSRLRIGVRLNGAKSRAGYLCMRIKVNNKIHNLLLHRAIFLYHRGYLPDIIDHKNGNPIDNRIENLRPCSLSENRANSVKKTKAKSKYKGVQKNGSRWAAVVRRKHIGNFKTEIEAAIAYNKAALKEYGEFAKLNEVG